MQVDAEGASLNYEISGNSSKPALLLWHGAGCTLRMWDMALDSLKREFFCITFDIRGAGQSSVNFDTASQFTFEQYSKDINLILAELDIQNTHLWSMAWGTRAAIAYSSLYPEKVISAVFSDASIGSANIEAQKEGARKALAMQEDLGIARFELPEGWNEHIDRETAQLSLTAASKFDLDNVINDLRIPILVMTGEYDPNLESSKEISKRLPSANLKVLKNVGHGSVLQRPDLTVDNFLEFHTSLGVS
tara:strand:- start:157 stop:900 length:744 start_codon:yes stop_codon:yes gene_type:complete